MIRAALLLVLSLGSAGLGAGTVPTTMRAVAIDQPGALFGDQQDQFAELNSAVEAKPFEVPIAATFDLADAAAAHRRVEAGRVPGKVLLRIR